LKKKKRVIYQLNHRFAKKKERKLNAKKLICCLRCSGMQKQKKKKIKIETEI
jgi:hypothetical protein